MGVESFQEKISMSYKTKKDWGTYPVKRNWKDMTPNCKLDLELKKNCYQGDY